MKSEDDRVKLQACRDVLRTLGKSRGYVERQEITGAEGGPLKTETEINLDNLSIDELKQLKHILRGAINKDGS